MRGHPGRSGEEMADEVAEASQTFGQSWAEDEVRLAIQLVHDR